MMKFVLALCLLVASSSASLAAPIKPGERITYKITKLGIKAGEATLIFSGPKVYRKTKTVLIIFVARAFNFFDEEHIYVDPKTYRPLFVERNLNIFGKKERILEEYLDGKIRITKGKEVQVIDKAGEIDNIYGFICRFRQEGEFKIDESIALKLPTKDVTIKVLKKDTIAAAKKKYETYYLESDSKEYKLWFDASEKKIPLRINGAVKMANADMIMTKYEN
jgi:hypothetical protein